MNSPQPEDVTPVTCLRVAPFAIRRVRPSNLDSRTCKGFADPPAMFRPFQPPLLKNRPLSQQKQAPPAKRRRLNDEGTNIARTVEPRRTEPLEASRKPLLAVPNPAAATTDATTTQDGSAEGYYTVLWCSHPFSSITAGVELTLTS